MSSGQNSVQPSCAGCGSAGFRRLFTAPGFDDPQQTFDLVECEKCGLVRTEPLVSDAALNLAYAPAYYGLGRRKFAAFFEWFTHWCGQHRTRLLLREVHRQNRDGQPQAPIRVLDIGCGRGTMLQRFQEQGCDCTGVERAEFPEGAGLPGIRLIKGDLAAAALPAGTYDLVVLWHVLEHLTEPDRMLEEAVRVLRPGGILVVAVPNFGSFQARCFTRAWFHLDLPRHLHHFTIATLRRLLEKHRLSVISRNTWSFEQNQYGFIQSLLNRLRPGARPNALYELLKRHDTAGEKIRLTGWLLLAGLLLPAAYLEYLVSGLAGTGATIIVFANKPGNA